MLLTQDCSSSSRPITKETKTNNPNQLLSQPKNSEACAKCILQFLLLCFYCCCNVSHKDGRKGKTFTVSYLVDSLGLTTKLAESISRKVSFEEKGNPDSVMGLFRSHGFTDSQISDIASLWEMFKKWPFALKFSEKKITQTFETLKRCGLLENEVMSLLKRNPQFIRISEEDIVNSVETLIDLGFSRDKFALMIKRYPQCIGFSAETVKKKTEFLVKKMKWPLKSLVSHPQVFGYSMEKRIVPRCNVIEALMSKGLLGDRSELTPMSSVLGVY
ncbi:unnamed protein product [Thlaspi arvense]|uniref:Uncharacterized protein n=1 Tax=Thlaspi arvense TaxID=13288 RepID=A0AAU9RQJ4_THLAR|nr:unnamed protein product [Thlaspi arvense]